MGIVQAIQSAVSTTLNKDFGLSTLPQDILVNETKPEFSGDYTVVLFSFIKSLKKSPEQLGNELGTALLASEPSLFTGFNIIKGFLNLEITDSYWTDFLQQWHSRNDLGQHPATAKRVMVEYSSPNTNKPLHLGHLRNNFLGWSMAEIFKKNGYEVVKTSFLNDRGIHICKSMIAWQLFGNGATPESTGIKGDHLVGDYYVMFGEEWKKQIQEGIEKGMTKEEAEKEAPIMKAAQQMLVDWEAGKPEVIDIWKMMNSWVYNGFKVTYERIGCDFDKTYFE